MSIRRLSSASNSGFPGSVIAGIVSGSWSTELLVPFQLVVPGGEVLLEHYVLRKR
jgi:hypothetical protein